MIHGLQHDLKGLQQLLSRKQAYLDSSEGTPNERHAVQVEVKELEAKIFATMGAILEGGEMVREIQGILNQLHVSKHPSRHRSLVITELENAQSRLLRELGDKPHETA